MSNEVFDAILDRPEPVGPLTALEARVAEMEERLAKVEIELIRNGLGH